MNKKLAIIKPKLNLLQLSVVKQFDNIDMKDFFKLDFNVDKSDIKKYLQSAINQLYEKQLIKSKSIVINYFSNLNPVQITFFVDCQFNILKLKQLQSCLLQNEFALKIIL